MASFESQLMAGVPARLAGPLSVCMASFATLALVWMVLAKRPLTKRLEAEASERQSAGVKTVKAELATRIISWIHAAVVGVAGLRMMYAYSMGLPGPDGTTISGDGTYGLPGLDWKSPFLEFCTFPGSFPWQLSPLPPQPIAPADVASPVPTPP